MSNPVHNHSATMPPSQILMIGVGWIGQLGRAEPLYHCVTNSNLRELKVTLGDFRRLK